MTILNYTISYVDIALVVIFLVSAIAGYKKGLLLTIVNIIRYVVGFSLCMFCSTNLAEPIYNTYVRSYALEYIDSKIVANNKIGDIISTLNETKQSLSPFVSNFVKMGDAGEIKIPQTDDISAYILDTIAQPIIIGALKAIIFAVVFIAFFAATGLIIRLVQNVSSRRDKKRYEKNKGKSAPKRINSVLGAALGVIKAMVLILAITSVLSFALQFVADNGTVYELLSQSKILVVLNNINPFNLLTSNGG